MSVLVERLHETGNGSYWVYYELQDGTTVTPLADYPDDGKPPEEVPVSIEVIQLIRKETGISLSKAINLWKSRRIEGVYQCL